ncbi:LrgB family protein [Aeromicrobium ponti]|uniref:Putative murein hydrolase (TIGR00659 family) n=1 Tax=Cytobacillus oceanisediminis TaxID=665099 RepID=A0A562K5T8_9BACI|nr:LrgB family protein [Cytobacillus oceanisediminis]TWH90792.1 putative murein hydrolase (TIGR00659 family) [Cytobacillus oceanisediminis]
MNSLILTLISIVLTITVYFGATALSRRVVSPFTTPILTATIVMIVILSSFDISYEQYSSAKEWITSLLGPATVALAVPLYKNREIIMEKLMPAVFGLVIGTLSTILSAVWISKTLGLSDTIQATSAVKAVTTPVAIEAVVLIGGDPALAAAFVITSGIFGAVFGPALLTVTNISDPFSRGLGIGTVSHGIGTSQAVAEGPVTGAVSSVAMGASAIITSIILPWVYPLIQL